MGAEIAYDHTTDTYCRPAGKTLRHCSFDFVTCQFGFHHLPDKGGMLRGVLRVLRSNGRFAMRNLCPQAHPDWLYYKCFPGSAG